jgi:hypothetical protein
MVGLLPRVVFEDDRKYSQRLQNERGYFERRVSMMNGVIEEYNLGGARRMYQDFVRDLSVFDQTPFPRRRWFSIAGIRIPLVSK